MQIKSGFQQRCDEDLLSVFLDTFKVGIQRGRRLFIKFLKWATWSDEFIRISSCFEIFCNVVNCMGGILVFFLDLNSKKWLKSMIPSGTLDSSLLRSLFSFVYTQHLFSVSSLAFSGLAPRHRCGRIDGILIVISRFRSCRSLPLRRISVLLIDVRKSCTTASFWEGEHDSGSLSLGDTIHMPLLGQRITASFFFFIGVRKSFRT
jgi:hypothetical protein